MLASASTRIVLAPAATRHPGTSGRPNVLVRYPNGITGAFFCQKRAPTFRGEERPPRGPHDPIQTLPVGPLGEDGGEAGGQVGHRHGAIGRDLVVDIEESSTIGAGRVDRHHVGQIGVGRPLARDEDRDVARGKEELLSRAAANTGRGLGERGERQDLARIDEVERDALLSARLGHVCRKWLVWGPDCA